MVLEPAAYLPSRVVLDSSHTGIVWYDAKGQTRHHTVQALVFITHPTPCAAAEEFDKRLR